jgi:hypothetical protein
MELYSSRAVLIMMVKLIIFINVEKKGENNKIIVENI